MLSMVEVAVGRGRILGIHTRICRKMPFHHYDHTHLLPHHLELYCQVLYTLYFALPCAQYTHTERQTHTAEIRT